MSDQLYAATAATQISNLPFPAALALNRKNAAATLGISTVTLDRLVTRGLIRPVRACRKPLFSTRELERFLDIHAVSATR